MTRAMLPRAIRTCTLACVACCTYQYAHAELGGAAMPPQAAGKTVQRAQVTGLYRVQSTIDDGGTTLYEYSSSAGQVFAYTWQGPTMPDLQTLLGRFYDSYRAGATPDRTTARSLHGMRVEQPDVVVESGGQMRSYVGRAWLPNALPAGVSADDLR